MSKESSDIKNSAELTTGKIRENTLKYFVGIAFAIAIIFPLVTIYYVLPLFEQVTIETVENETVQKAKHLAAMLDFKNGELHDKAFTPDLKNKINHLQSEYNLMNIKIFSLSGKVIYSSYPDEIGEFKDKLFLNEIITNGKAYTKHVEKNTPSRDGMIVKLDVIETYVPILDGDNAI